MSNYDDWKTTPPDDDPEGEHLDDQLVPRKAYLGDGCYVAFDGYALVLTTEDGIQETNRIVLEPDVFKALAVYVDRHE